MRQIFNKYNLFINIYISLIINIVLSIVLPLATIGIVNFPIFIKGFAIAFTISTLFVLFIPINKLGDLVARKLHLKERGVPFTLVSTAVLALILSTMMSMIMTLVNAGPDVPFIPAWLSGYPYAVLSVYLSALLGNFTAFPLATKIFGPPGR